VLYKDISAFEIEAYKIKRKNTPIISSHKGEAKRTERPRALAVINREVCLLSAIFTPAMAKGEVTKNPCQKISLYQEQNRERYLKPEEEARLMPLLEHKPYLRDMVILAINTGMRQGELFKLKPERIDFVRNIIIVTETKSGKDRKVPMNDKARELMLRLVDEAKTNDWKYIFTKPKTLTRFQTIKTAWVSVCKLAKIENLRFHDPRHTFGTRAIDAGAPVSAVKEVMGHTDISTTMRYVHATEEGKRKAVEAAANWGKGKTSATNLPQSKKAAS
jgi:integrase